MSSTLWEFNIENKKATKTWIGKLNNIYIKAAFNNLELVSHFIFESEEEKFDLNFNPVFELVPKEHNKVTLEDINEIAIDSLSDLISVHSFNNTKANLLLRALHSLIKNKNTSNELIAYVNKTTVCLLFQQNGKLVLGNSFEIENYAELVYFFTACANQFGLSTANINYHILSSEPEIELRKVLDDFIPNQQYIACELPYKNDKFPPYSAELYLLILLNKCELQAVS